VTVDSDQYTPGPELRSLLSGDDFAAQLTGVHLQWFAAEDEGRTEEPTEHKIRKAREEGKVAKSQDVAQSIVLLFTVVLLGIIGKYFFGTMAEMVAYFISQSTTVDITVDFTVARAFFGYFLRLVWPIAAVAVTAAILGNVLQVGLLFTVKPITPDFNRVAPRFGRWLQRSFFSAEAIFNLSKSVIKIIIIVGIAVLIVVSSIGQLVNLLHATVLQGVSVIATLTFRILVWSAVVLLFFSLFDYLFQRRQHLESLKMSKQEVKEERRMYEGDPLVKGRLRRRMQDLLNRNLVRKVPEADVVVTNPTHYAVALEYNREMMRAPTVTAKGQDNIAQRIRELATEYNVPLIENRPLARALYADVEIGDEIPEKYYEAVVAVLKQVYQMNKLGAAGQSAAAGGPGPR
jgi:flagellar biosynthesis protein FlhB